MTAARAWSWERRAGDPIWCGAVGKTLEAAFQNTVKLETLARQYLTALQAGEPVPLPPEEMTRVGARYGNYGVGLLPG